MELKIGNCPQCGKLFSRGVRDICPDCYQEVEKQYNLCAEHLRENRHLTIFELSEATGVSVKQITRFIREGRISLFDSPNLGYPCESCGDLIRQGALCGACQARLRKDITNVREDEQRKQAQLEELAKRSAYKIKGNEKN